MSKSTASTVPFTLHDPTSGRLLATATTLEQAAAIWEAQAPAHPIVLGFDGLPAATDAMAGAPETTLIERKIYGRWRKRAEQLLRTRAGRLALQLGVAPAAVAYHRVRHAEERYEAWHGAGWYRRGRRRWHWVRKSEHTPSATPHRLDIDLLAAKDGMEVAHA